jgi:adenosylhomocysteine nucleosidase
MKQSTFAGAAYACYLHRMDLDKIGFVTGLTAELALLKASLYRAAAGGGTPEGAGDAASRLITEGAEALISFGLAGGLDPTLPPGAILVPERVVKARETYLCDPALVAWLGGPTCAAMFAGASVAVTAAQKVALFTQTGADAIDLESGAVARVAAAAGIPFAVLRAVCDPAGRDLPPAALVALNARGRIAGFRVLASVMRRPDQVPGLLKLAGDAAVARRALQARLKTLG